MKTATTLFMAIGLATAFAACDSHNDNPTGSWTASAPENVTQAVADATAASKQVSIDFNAPQNGEDGTLTLTAVYDVTSTVQTDSVPQEVKYQVTASINGTWAQDVDNHDDYLLTFDKNSLTVNGSGAPGLGAVTDEFLNSLAQYTSIEDVEVSKDGKHLTFESGKPEVKYHFVLK